MSQSQDLGRRTLLKTGGRPDELEFQRLYRANFGFVFQRARRMLRDEEEAVDAAQETFARAWERWRDVALARSKTGWLLVTVTRLAIDRLRRRRFDLRAVVRRGDAPAKGPANDHALHLLRIGLGREKPLRQQIVIHTMIDGMTQEETAALLGISRKTVQRHLDAFRTGQAADLARAAELVNGL